MTPAPRDCEVGGSCNLDGGLGDSQRTRRRVWLFQGRPPPGSREDFRAHGWALGCDIRGCRGTREPAAAGEQTAPQYAWAPHLFQSRTAPSRGDQHKSHSPGGVKRHVFIWGLGFPSICQPPCLPSSVLHAEPQGPEVTLSPCPGNLKLPVLGCLFFPRCLPDPTPSHFRDPSLHSATTGQTLTHFYPLWTL